MKYDEFIGQVQHRARLASSGEAVAATRAALQTLAERLTPGAVDNLAAQLPREIGELLRAPVTAGMADRFSLNDYFHRVSGSEGADLPAAVFHARVVIEVLEEAVSPGEIAKVRAQLPAEFDPLFEAGSEGPLRKKGAEAATIIPS
jgi:uncharacterized protein (DUF2267 family)